MERLSRAMAIASALLMAGLAGCMQLPGRAPPPTEPLPSLEFWPMAVLPAEPWPDPEAEVLVAWQNGVLGVAARHVPGLPAQAVSGEGLLFTRDGSAEDWSWRGLAPASDPVARSVAGWDAVALLRSGRVVSHDATVLVSQAPVAWDGEALSTVRVTHRDGVVTLVEIEHPGDPQAPYRLVPAHGFPFAPLDPLLPTPAD